MPTQRGYSPSASPRHRREYRTVELSNDVIALLDAAGIERAHIVGHDWGGALAWGMAGRHPDRTASVVVLSTPHPAAMVDAFRHSNQALKSWYMGFFQLPLLPEVLTRRTLARLLRASGLPEQYVTIYVYAMADPGAMTGAINWYRGIPFSMRDPVGRIRVPTTYIWGRHDVALNRLRRRGDERLRHRPVRVPRPGRQPLAARDRAGCGGRGDREAGAQLGGLMLAGH